MAKGGLTKGASHAKGGIKMTVKDTGQQIEVEGGEGIINKHVMSSDKKLSYKGKKMTPCEIASDLNQTTGNGVGFDCAETKNTDMTPTDPNTGFALGGYVEFSDFVPEYDYAKGGRISKKNVIDLKSGDVIRRYKLGHYTVFIVNTSAKQDSKYKNEYNVVATALVSTDDYYEPFEEYTLKSIIKEGKLGDWEYIGEYERGVDYSEYVRKRNFAKGGQVTCPNCSTDFFAEGGKVNNGNDLMKLDAKFRKVAMPKPIPYYLSKNTAYSPKNKELMDVLAPIASTDDLRPAMTGVYFDRENNYIAVTNAHILMRMNYPLPFTNNKGKVVSGTENGIYATDKSLKKEYKKLSKNLSRDQFLTFDEWKKKFPSYLTIDAKYPNYNQVIPQPLKGTLGSNVDIRKLYWYSSVLLKAKSKGDSILKENNLIYFQVTNPSTQEKQLVGFNAKYVQTITKAIIQLQRYWSNHNTDLMFPYYYVGEQRPFCLFLNIFREQVYQHKGDGDVGLIMPMQLDYRGFDVLLNDDLKDLPINLIYDCDSNTILSNGNYYEIDASVGYGKAKKIKSAPKKEAQAKEHNCFELSDWDYTFIKSAIESYYKDMMKNLKFSRAEVVNTYPLPLQLKQRMERYLEGEKADNKQKDIKLTKADIQEQIDTLSIALEYLDD